jgi:hypothetical protein
MLLIIPILLLIPLALWVLAEVKASRFSLRIAAGACAIIAIATITHLISGVAATEEQAAHRIAMRMVEARISRGETNRACRAIALYNRVESTNGTHRAAVAVIVALEDKRHETGEQTLGQVSSEAAPKGAAPNEPSR